MLHQNSGLFSSSAVRPLAPYFCSWVTRKSQLFCVKIICYNPRQNYLRKFSSSCPLFYATKLFPKRCLCGKKTPSPSSMLLPTKVQGSGFFLNTQQHCFQVKEEREEPVHLQCLEKCFSSMQFSLQFCPRLQVLWISQGQSIRLPFIVLKAQPWNLLLCTLEVLSIT